MTMASMPYGKHVDYVKARALNRELQLRRHESYSPMVDRYRAMAARARHLRTYGVDASRWDIMNDVFYLQRHLE